MARSEWEAAEAAHDARVDAATAAHLRRRADGRRHPVEDFLFTYYSQRPAQLRRWHPGPGWCSRGGRSPARWLAVLHGGRPGSAARPDQLRRARGDDRAVRRATCWRQPRARPGRFGCFGLHEWAMVYRLGEDEVRHAGWPLRLGAAGTDAVVEAHQLRCSHFDAFRFFTPPARPLNAAPADPRAPGGHGAAGLPARQDGPLQVGVQALPAVPSDLVMDCFELAREIRELDMRASPYDLRELGYDAGADRDAAGQGAVRRRATRLRSPRPGPPRPATRRGGGPAPRAGGQRTGTPARTRP